MSVIVAQPASSGSTSGSGSNPTLYADHPVSPSLPAAGGDNSIALGSGAVTESGATGAIAIGNQSLARLPGSEVFASGRFGSLGDAQAGKYMLRAVSTNGFPTQLYLNGTTGQQLTLTDDSTWTFTVTVTGHRQDVSDGHAGFKAEGVVYRQSGANTVSLQGNPTISVLGRSDQQWSINIGTDTTSGSLTINVVGQAGKIIRWVALVETLEVTN
jgi:hypothetical protein